MLLTNEAALEANRLSIVPTPDDHTVLTSQSELKVAEEVRKWHHEELVAPPDDNTTCPNADSVVLGVPLIKVLVTLVDQCNFLRQQLVFIKWLWWINDVPKLFVLVIDEVVDEESDAWHRQHPRLAINEGE